MSTDELLITLEDIRAIHNVARNLNTDNRILSQILETQRMSLVAWLGNKFYRHIWNNKATYTLLLDGGDYTYNGEEWQLFGLKNYIAYQALARIVRSNDLHVTATGNVFKDTEQSTPANTGAEMNTIKALSDTAMAYKDNIMEYLCRNQSQYPLYCGCNSDSGIDNKGLEINIGYGKFGKLKW